MPETADEVLAQRAQVGDQAALVTLYRRHLDTIYRYIYTRVGNRPQAEDLTAEVFTRMLENLDGYDATQGDFRPWLYGIARHVLTDFWRRYYRVEKVPLKAFLDLSERDEPPADSRLKAWADELLAALPDKYRRVLELRILEGRSVAETAQAMDITENYVKVLQHRALKRAAELGGRPDDEQRRDWTVEPIPE